MTLTIHNGLLVEATQRPLGKQTEPLITPLVLGFHTMVGYLPGTYSMFKQGGFDGVESHLGLGGPWDADGGLDGALWQFQTFLRQADAQGEGNGYVVSVECSDGGDPHRPMSSKQLMRAIDLTAAFCKTYGRACELVPATGPIGKAGVGYHSRRTEWNPHSHSCPSPVREAQIRTIIIPKARAILAPKPPAPKPTPAPTHHLVVDGVFGPDTIKVLQAVIKTHVDGVFGPDTRRALQKYLSVTVDGVVGPRTIAAMQHRLIARGYACRRDGVWDKGTTMALQRALNAGRF